MPHATSNVPFERRASTHPLSVYLFNLMSIKRSNLCLSADVSSAETLLHLASTLGPIIVVLKTHFDIVNDWDSHPRRGTGAQLATLARRHGFLIFEDRKFSDIGSTVQKQYTNGPAKIVEWAHITNAHILPGPAIVAALAQAASRWRERKKCEVKTDISVGTPRPESDDSYDDSEEETPRVSEDNNLKSISAGRKASIVSITTVSQSFEPADSRWSPSRPGEDDEAYAGVDEPPLERGLLLLAQMSSAGNLLDATYTQTCVGIARQYQDFVMGYVAQESLNQSPNDQFITMTPGCQLPPQGGAVACTNGTSDGLGQQYNTPQKLVGLLGTDIIIVGRGILNAPDPVAEAERYREEAWDAYEQRVAGAK